MLLYVLVCIALILIIFVLLQMAFGLADALLIDNTKKKIILTTVLTMECTQNESQCTVMETFTNKTELGNVSKGLMKTTKL